MNALRHMIIPVAAGLFAFNATAQEHGAHTMPMPMPSHEQTPAPQHTTRRQKGHPLKPAAQPMDHSSMDHSSMDHSSMDHSSMDHSSMDHSSMDHSSMDHSSMDHSSMDHAMPAPANQPRTPIPVLTDSDRAAAQPPPHDHPVHDSSIQDFVLFDRLEGFDADSRRGFEWQGQAWVGTDLNKLRLRTEGERVGRHIESADLEVLYGRAIARWWDVVAGVRHDFKPGSSQDFAAIGVMGRAPYKFEVEATGYVGQSGQTSARLEAEYEALLTQRLILQPLTEINVYGKDDAQRGIGSGLSSAEAGLRLRYEVTRQFAPYVGVVREWTFGRTADFRRDAGENINDTRIVAGLRIWF